jgi:hypothetical protein
VNTLFATTAVIEAGAGLALLCLPSAAAKLLLGTPLQEPSAFTVGRVGGAGLLTLGVACWLARSDTQSSAARGLVTALVVYNLVVALVLATAGLRSQPVGIILWPAVVLHTAMTAWCVVSFRHPRIARRPGNLQQ